MAMGGNHVDCTVRRCFFSRRSPERVRYRQLLFAIGALDSRSSERCKLGLRSLAGIGPRRRTTSDRLELARRTRSDFSIIFRTKSLA